MKRGAYAEPEVRQSEDHGANFLLHALAANGLSQTRPTTFDIQLLGNRAAFKPLLVRCANDEMDDTQSHRGAKVTDSQRDRVKEFLVQTWDRKFYAGNLAPAMVDGVMPLLSGS